MLDRGIHVAARLVQLGAPAVALHLVQPFGAGRGSRRGTGADGSMKFDSYSWDPRGKSKASFALGPLHCGCSSSITAAVSTTTSTALRCGLRRYSRGRVLCPNCGRYEPFLCMEPSCAVGSRPSSWR